MQRELRLLTAAALLGALPSAQTTWTVPGDAPSISSAVDLASSGDTILVSPGTWTTVNVGFQAKELTLRSTDGPEATILDGLSAGRHLFLTGSQSSETVIEGFTFYAGSVGSGGDGGSVYLSTIASPVFRDCVFRFNRAGTGSSGSTGSNGSSGGDGDDGKNGGTGGAGGSGGDGGAIYVQSGSPTFERCAFYDNRTGSGGKGGTGGKGGNGGDEALFTPPGDGGNGGRGGSGGSGGEGGAIYARDPSSVVTLVNCLFAANTTGSGGQGGTGGSGGSGGDGGLVGGDGSNGSQGDGGDGGSSGFGGALFGAGGDFRAINCTFFGNQVGSPGIDGSGPGGSDGSEGTGSVVYVTSSGTTIDNSLLWANEDGAAFVSGAAVSASYCNSSPILAGLGNFSKDPQLFIDSSAPWQSYTPMAGSGCIDAGNSTLLPAGTTKDLTGHLRRIDDPLTVDVGVGPGPMVDVGAREYTPAAEVRMLSGCGQNPPGSFVHLGGLPRPGETVTLGIDNPLGTQSFGSIPFLLVSLAPDPGSPCGTLLPLQGMAGGGAPGELLVGLLPGQLFQVLPAGVWLLPGNPAPVDLPITPKDSLLGLSVWVQGAIVDISAGATVPVGWTEGAELFIGI